MIRRLITDRDVLRGDVSSPIVLDAQTLLTPAARDRAVQKGFVIVERGDVGGRDDGAGSCGGSCDGACGGPTETSTTPCAHTDTHSLNHLPDGLHLVRVEGGRIVSALPSAGAGLMQPARGGNTP